MAFEFARLDADRRIQVTASGPIDFREILAAFVTIVERPDFEPHFSVLIDAREIEFTPSGFEIEQFARQLGRFKRDIQGRVAILVKGNLHFGLARMTCSVAEANGFPMRPFTDLEQARSWLDGADA